MPSDDRMVQEVPGAVAGESCVAEAEILVAGNAAVVRLSGSIERFMAEHAAASRVERVQGTRAVAEEIELRLRFDIRRGDAAIATAAIDRLARDGSVPRGAVSVKVEQGWITLTGQVDSVRQKEAAAHDVHGLFGVVGVSDKIAIKPRARSTNSRDENSPLVYRSWFFDPKSVTLSTDGETIRLVASREYYKYEGGLTA